MVDRSQVLGEAGEQRVPSLVARTMAQGLVNPVPVKIYADCMQANPYSPDPRGGRFTTVSAKAGKSADGRHHGDQLRSL